MQHTTKEIVLLDEDDVTIIPPYFFENLKTMEIVDYYFPVTDSQKAFWKDYNEHISEFIGANIHNYQLQISNTIIHYTRAENHKSSIILCWRFPETLNLGFTILIRKEEVNRNYLFETRNYLNERNVYYNFETDDFTAFVFRFDQADDYQPGIRWKSRHPVYEREGRVTSMSEAFRIAKSIIDLITSPEEEQDNTVPLVTNWHNPSDHPNEIENLQEGFLASAG